MTCSRLWTPTCCQRIWAVPWLCRKLAFCEGQQNRQGCHHALAGPSKRVARAAHHLTHAALAVRQDREKSFVPLKSRVWACFEGITHGYTHIIIPNGHRHAGHPCARRFERFPIRSSGCRPRLLNQDQNPPAMLARQGRCPHVVAATTGGVGGGEQRRRAAYLRSETSGACEGGFLIDCRFSTWVRGGAWDALSQKHRLLRLRLRIQRACARTPGYAGLITFEGLRRMLSDSPPCSAVPDASSHVTRAS